MYPLDSSRDVSKYGRRADHGWPVISHAARNPATVVPTAMARLRHRGRADRATTTTAPHATPPGPNLTSTRLPLRAPAIASTHHVVGAGSPAPACCHSTTSDTTIARATSSGMMLSVMLTARANGTSTAIAQPVRIPRRTRWSTTIVNSSQSAANWYTMASASSPRSRNVGPPRNPSGPYGKAMSTPNGIVSSHARVRATRNDESMPKTGRIDDRFIPSTASTAPSTTGPVSVARRRDDRTVGSSWSPCSTTRPSSTSCVIVSTPRLAMATRRPPIPSGCARYGIVRQDGPESPSLRCDGTPAGG